MYDQLLISALFLWLLGSLIFTDWPAVWIFVAAMLGTPTPDEICAGDFDGSSDLGAGDIAGMANALVTAP